MGRLKQLLTDQRGSVSMEMVVIGPSLMALILFIVFVSRSVTVDHAVDEAARSAARAASLETSSARAQSAAHAAAAASLSSQDINCAVIDVHVDTTAVGTRSSGHVSTVTISCTVSMGDLALPGAGLTLPGSKTFTSTFSSPLDPHRDLA